MVEHREEIQENEQQTVYAKEYAANVEAGLLRIYDGILTLVMEKLESDETVACEIWNYGPDAEGANVVLDATPGVQHLIETKEVVKPIPQECVRQRTVEEMKVALIREMQEQLVEVVDRIVLERVSGNVGEQTEEETVNAEKKPITNKIACVCAWLFPPTTVETHMCLTEQELPNQHAQYFFTKNIKAIIVVCADPFSLCPAR